MSTSPTKKQRKRIWIWEVRKWMVNGNEHEPQLFSEKRRATVRKPRSTEVAVCSIRSRSEHKGSSSVHTSLRYEGRQQRIDGMPRWGAGFEEHEQPLIYRRSLKATETTEGEDAWRTSSQRWTAAVTGTYCARIVCFTFGCRYELHFQTTSLERVPQLLHSSLI